MAPHRRSDYCLLIVPAPASINCVCTYVVRVSTSSQTCLHYPGRRSSHVGAHIIAIKSCEDGIPIRPDRAKHQLTLRVSQSAGPQGRYDNRLLSFVRSVIYSSRARHAYRPAGRPRTCLWLTLFMAGCVRIRIAKQYVWSHSAFYVNFRPSQVFSFCGVKRLH